MWGRLATLVTTLAVVTTMSRAGAAQDDRAVTEADCVAPSLVATIAPAAIGEPVRSVTRSGRVGRGQRHGAGALPRRRRVCAGRHVRRRRASSTSASILPASWNRRAAQLGGGGINGVIPNLTGGEFGAGGPSLLQRGFVTYGSDSGHQLPAFGRRGGPPAAPPDQEWALNDEAIRNFGYAQMKKTHDAAMVLIQRMYGERPRFNYYIGTSQGGREGADRRAALSRRLRRHRGQRADRELLVADARARAHSHPRKAARQLGDAGEDQRDPRRVHAAVRRARRARRRHHQQLHGLPRDLRRQPRRARPPSLGGEALPGQRRSRIRPTRARTPASPTARSRRCEFVYSHYKFATPLANGVREFGMWLPNTDPSGSGLDPAGTLQGTGRRAGGCADALASRRPRRHRVSDAGRQGQPARLRRRRSAQRAAARRCRRSSTRRTPTSARSRAAAAR